MGGARSPPCSTRKGRMAELRVPQPEFSSACSAIARALATPRGLDEVIVHIEAAARLVVPFHAMGLWHADAGDDRVSFVPGPSALQVVVPASGRPLRRADHSPRLWPEA